MDIKITFNKDIPKTFNLKWIIVGICLIGLGFGGIAFANFIKPNNFTEGTVISSSQINENFDDIYTALNSLNNRLPDYPVAQEQNLKIVRGTVDGDGTVIVGSGFTITKLSSGCYQINFSQNFSAAPSGAVSQLFTTGGDDGGDTRDNALLTVMEDSRVIVITGMDTGARTDRAFSFFLIGPQ